MRFISFILILGVLLQWMSGPLIYMEFQINRSFIAQFLCEKKELPGNHCQGKCHLKKQLTRNSEQQESRKIVLQQLSDPLMCQHFDQTFIQYPNSNIMSLVTLNEHTPTDGFLFGIFRPPTAA